METETDAFVKNTPFPPPTPTRRLLKITSTSQGKPFCTCWVHNAFVNVDGEKMSKSKGNFLTLKGTLDTGLDVRAFRYLVVSSQYRTTLGFSKNSLEGAKNTVQRLDKLRVRLRCGCVWGMRIAFNLAPIQSKERAWILLCAGGVLFVLRALDFNPETCWSVICGHRARSVKRCLRQP